MKPSIVGIILLSSISLSSCFKAATTNAGSVREGSKSGAKAPKTLSESKAVYAVNPKDSNLLEAPQGALKGASVAVPPHSLAISLDIILEEAVALGETSLASDLGLGSDLQIQTLGTGLILRPSVDSPLLGALTITMPLDSSLNLKGETVAFAVLYKQFRDGVLYDGIVPSADLRISEDFKVSFEGYFGSYWLVKVSSPIEERTPVASTESIVNFQRVSVIETNGITTESNVVEKAIIPQIAWKAVNMSFDKESRAVSLAASVEGATALHRCKADFGLELDDKNPVVVESGSTLQANLSITRVDAHSLYGRFRCFDELNRLVVSNWSPVLAIPALSETTDYPSEAFLVLTPQIQSRGVLKLSLGAELFPLETSYQLYNSTTQLTLLDSTLAPTGASTILNGADGSQQLSFKVSPLGQLQNFSYGSNSFALKNTSGTTLLEVAATIRDFTLFEGATMSSFPSSRQISNDGLQAWTNVLSNPVVTDQHEGQTQLTQGMLNIINP